MRACAHKEDSALVFVGSSTNHRLSKHTQMHKTRHRVTNNNSNNNKTCNSFKTTKRNRELEKLLSNFFFYLDGVSSGKLALVVVDKYSVVRGGGKGSRSSC